MNGDLLQRRTVLRAIGAATAMGALGVGAVGSAAAAPTLGPRTGANGNEVFLGGDFFELGIRADGSFGTSGSAPADFFGSRRGAIGMYADFDGFDAGTNTEAYDYFLPGTPEERFSVGFVPSGADIDNAETGSNGNNAGFQMPTTQPTAEILGTELRSEFSSTFENILRIDHIYSFENSNKFFRVDVTIENTGDEPVDSVRYQRSVDPDNGVDVGCSFTTTNTVVSQPPASDEALVKAELRDGDSCSLASVSRIPIFYYSSDSRARVSAGASGLTPSPVVYAPGDYDSPQAEGTVVTADSYIAITFDFGTLAPGESASTTYYTALTNDVDETRDDIVDSPREPEPEPVPDDTRARFSLVCDRSGCIEETVDGNERVELSNDAPDVGEEIELAVTVTNVGDERGAYFGELTDGFRDFGARRVVLEPGEKTTLVYTVSFERPGLYQMFLTGDHIVDIPVGLPFSIFSR